MPSSCRPLVVALTAILAARLGAQGVAPSAPPRSTFHARAFESPALGTVKHALVYLPPSYAAAPARRYPVLYYLHGMWGSEGEWARRGRLARVMDSLAAAGLPEAIVVMPDGDDGWYTTWNTLASLSGCEARVPPDEPRERYCVPWARYDDYVARDVVAWVDSTFRTRADRAHRGIAGLSMGGYGAVLLAAQYPDVFGAAASHSGALAPALRGGAGAPSAAAIEAAWGPRYWRYLRPVFGRDTVGWWARDPARLLAALHRTRPALVPALHVDVGRADPFLPQNRAFRDALGALGVEHRYAEWPGGHDWTYWRGHLAESLAWLLRRVSEPGGGS